MLPLHTHEASDTEATGPIRGRVTVAAVCGFNKERPLGGIIAHLARKYSSPDCDNVCSLMLVKVTSSVAWRGCPRNIVDLTSNSVFCSVWGPNSWICYKFREERVGGVTPTSYSIRSVGYGPGWYHPKSWVLEVSHNGKEGSWVVVDSRENNEDLNRMHVIRNFAISDPPSGVFSFVRLRRLGRTTSETIVLLFARSSSSGLSLTHVPPLLESLFLTVGTRRTGSSRI